MTRFLSYLILFVGGLITLLSLAAFFFFLLPYLLVGVVGAVFLYFLGLLMAWAADNLHE
jgi:hypothetical protein